MALKPSHEPVAYSNAVNVILTALVSVGWLTVPNATVDAIATAVGAVGAMVVAFVARASAKPLALVRPGPPAQEVGPVPPGV
jgi:hypothetical protein